MLLSMIQTQDIYKSGGLLMPKLSQEKIYQVDLSQIDEPEGIIRLEIDQDEISELAKSIAEIGQLQPIVLRRSGDRFEVVAGHRRFLAHKLLEAKTIKATIHEMDGKIAALSRATENLARVNLTPVEEAAIYANLIQQHEMPIEEIAKRMGKSPSVVKRRLDIFKMPVSLQQSIHTGKINAGVAEELWRISDETDRDYHLELAIENGVTRRVAREWVSAWLKQQKSKQNTSEFIGGESPPYVERPVYISCDICAGPMKLGDEILIRACPECAAKIRSALK